MGKMIGITGGSGTICKILSENLINIGFKPNLFNGDIRKNEDIVKWMKFKKFDIIFHLAAIVPINEVNKNKFEAYSVNVDGTINLLSCIRKLKINPWIFYASTSHVYKIKDIPIKEDDEIQPLNIYGETKYLAERICESFVKSYGCKICIGRIFSFYHDTQLPPFLYPTIKRRLIIEDLSKSFFLRGAHNIRDIMNAEDVVDKIIKLMQLNYSGIINIGSGKGTTIEDFVRKQTNIDINIVTDEESNISTLIADITLLKNIIGDK